MAGLPEVIGGQLGRSGGQAKGVLSGAADTLSGAVRQDVSKTGGPRPPGPYGPAASSGRDLSHAAGQCRMLTARAITRSDVNRAETLWMLIKSFARVDSGIVSVGLKAVEFVTDT